MKLTDHVNLICTLIEEAFDKQLLSLGIGVNKELKLDEISKDLHVVRRSKKIGIYFLNFVHH
ncbi:hypothetical protein [Sulfurospirillum diekertiae]|uniref:Uncharacterized protein n=1 Tax=Sulfurospirillum diekertiae TaxID=1854492 RepID=A0A1Y0HJ87_9BACT|nr:hypothetical protein [Sulfurospirillum diekertiae]ARU48161.1 hypothetical protein Sdiek1_0995 [Sulfurospirillum diekertiae]ASC93004.1 hypothetical protein Sdiek2_0983 [Sulfurospirillum diekertiae]